jgi:hypothetical protein
MRIKKFNESVSDDIFDDEQNLKYILTEFSDIGFDYDIKYTLFYKKTDGQLDWLGDIKEKDFSKYRGKTEHTYTPICGYIIQFEDLLESEVATTYNDKRQGFSIPNDRFYLFHDKLKHIQGVIERMGYIFSINTNTSGNYQFMILEKF